MQFSKEDTAILKGVAIVMLMYHHCFCGADRFEKYVIDFAPLSQESVIGISVAFKVCVSIFAFISGYGLWKSYAAKKSSPGKWVYSRYIRTFNGYWFIFILVMLFTQLTRQLPVSVYYSDGSLFKAFGRMLSNFLGLHGLLGTVSFIGTWWYMTLALYIILIVPVCYELAGKIGIGLVYILSLIGPSVLSLGYPGDINPLSFISAAVLGMFFAEGASDFDLLALGRKNKTTNLLTFVVASLLVLIIFRIYLMMPTDTFWMLKYDLFPIVIIFYVLRFYHYMPTFVKKTVAFLGKYSMNIFLIHTFIRAVYCEKFIYSCYFWWLIPIVLLLATLPFALLVEGLKKMLKWNRFCDFLEVKFPDVICGLIRGNL